MKLASSLPRTLKDVIYTVLGALICGFALKSFLIPNNFLNGGIAGISLLFHELYHIDIALPIILINAPFIIAGGMHVNRKFAFEMLASVLLFSLWLVLLPYPIVTSDKLLESIFGVFFLGLGVGLAMRVGCAVDGIEVLALYTLKRSSFKISEIILGLNVILFLIATRKLGLETTLYSVLTYFTASRTISYLIEGLEEYTGVRIISGKSDEIKQRLVTDLSRGITV